MNWIDRFHWKRATPVGRLIAASLAKEPKRWSTDRGYYLCRDDGVDVWIANAAYGLRLRISGGIRGEEVMPTWHDRQLIWRAVRRLHIPSTRQFELARASQALAGDGSELHA